MIRLNQNQINRCYACFDFEDYEEIVGAYKSGKHALIIHYYDEKEQVEGTYLPFVEKDQMEFIMNGIKLERV